MGAWPGIADVAEPEVAQVGVERLFEPNFFQKRAGIHVSISHKCPPLNDDRGEYGWYDGEHTDKEKKNIASHQNQLPADIQRLMAEDVCSVHIEHAGGKNDVKRSSKEKDYVVWKYFAACQNQHNNSKEVGVTVSTWSFEDIR